MKSSNAAHKIIEAVTAPLGFFVLALLIVETFLAAVLISGKISSEDIMTGLWMGIFLFIFVTVTVFILVWFKPDHLTFDKEAHLIDRGKATYGTDTNPISDPDRLVPRATNTSTK